MSPTIESFSQNWRPSQAKLWFNLSNLKFHFIRNLKFDRRKEPDRDELQIYTWYNLPKHIIFNYYSYFIQIRHDATLRELTELIKEVSSPARGKNARLNYSLVYPDK